MATADHTRLLFNPLFSRLRNALGLKAFIRARDWLKNNSVHFDFSLELLWPQVLCVHRGAHAGTVQEAAQGAAGTAQLSLEQHSPCRSASMGRAGCTSVCVPNSCFVPPWSAEAERLQPLLVGTPAILE